MKYIFNKNQLSKAASWALTAILTTVLLTACGGSTDDKKSSLIIKTDHHNHDQHDDHDTEEKNQAIERRYAYQGKFPIETRLIHNKGTVDKYANNQTLPVSVVLVNGRPFVLDFNGEKQQVQRLQDWDSRQTAKQIIAMGNNVFFLTENNQILTFSGHGDHFHGQGDGIAIPDADEHSNLQFIQHGNHKLPFIFDQHTGKLWQINPNKQILDLNLTNILDFQPEHITWVGAKVDEDNKQNALNYHPESEENFDKVANGRWVVTGKTKTGQQKIAVIQHQHQAFVKDDVIFQQNLDYPVTALASSKQQRFAILVSNQHQDDKDKVTFLDGRLYLTSHNDHVVPVVAGVAWTKQQLNYPNPIINNYQQNKTIDVLTFLGNEKQKAGFFTTTESSILNKNSLTINQLTDNFPYLVTQTIGSRTLVLTPNQISIYDKKDGKYQLNQQHQLDCAVPITIINNPNHILLGCENRMYHMMMGYNEQQMKAFAFKVLGIENQSLIELLTKAKSDVMFDYQQINAENSKKYLSGIKEMHFSGVHGAVDKPFELEGIEYLSGLQKLVLNNLYLADDPNSVTAKIPQLFPNLQELQIAQTKITDLNFIVNLPKLHSLDISGNSVDDLLSEPVDLNILKQHPNRQNFIKLVSNENSIFDISFLAQMPKLQELYLGGNSIDNIDVIRDLTNLRKLVLFGNQISQLPDLSQLQKLEHISLNDNYLENIDTLAQLKQLSTLTADDNQIRQIPAFVANKSKLQILSLNNNQLTSLANLANLNQLQRIVVNKNQINRLDNLINVPNLRLLEIHHNQLSADSFNDLERLAGATTLVSFANNPVAVVHNQTRLGNFVLY